MLAYQSDLHKGTEKNSYPTISNLQSKKSTDSMNGGSFEGQIGLTLQHRTESPKKHLGAHSLKYIAVLRKLLKQTDALLPDKPRARTSARHMTTTAGNCDVLM